MAVRNFYIDARIDGRKTALAGGPAGKTGGMEVFVTQRSNGDITRAVTIKCVEQDGDLFTEIYDPNGKKVYEVSTVR